MTKIYTKKCRCHCHFGISEKLMAYTYLKNQAICVPENRVSNVMIRD